jgi:nitrous oxide reductase accessory protein NosL
MTKRDKLFVALLNNPKDCRFEDACKMAELLGFAYKGGKGSHRAFARAGEREALNFQNRNGRIAEYQARQLIAMFEKYGEDNG